MTLSLMVSRGRLMMDVFSIIKPMAAFCVVILACTSGGSCRQVAPFLLTKASQPTCLHQSVSNALVIPSFL